MTSPNPPKTHYVKAGRGYARAVWIKSRRRYRLKFLWCDTREKKVKELPASKVYWKAEDIHALRALKNKPPYGRVRAMELRPVSEDAEAKVVTVHPYGSRGRSWAAGSPGWPPGSPPMRRSEKILPTLLDNGHVLCHNTCAGG